MLRRIRLKIKCYILKCKMNYYERRYKASRRKSLELEGKYRYAATAFYYATQNTNPEKSWEMRAEREYLKGKL